MTYAAYAADCEVGKIGDFSLEIGLTSNFYWIRMLLTQQIVR